MSEAEELRAAQQLLAQGMMARAQPILWRLYRSRNPSVVLNAGLSLLAALDQLTENDALLQITSQSIALADALGEKDTHTYLLTQKAIFLFRKLTGLLYQRQNLKLAAKAFRWIDFSLEEDKSEYEALGREETRLEKEIADLEARALAELQSKRDHYVQGKILMGLAEISSCRFMCELGDLVTAGRWKSKIMNIYYVRRWNLDKLIGYDRKGRRKLRVSFRDAIALYKRAMDAFRTENNSSDAAHAAYAIALKYMVTFRFRRAQKNLNLARAIGDADTDKNLFTHIDELEKRIKDKYRHPRNYVEEFGLDLPKALRRQGHA